MILTRRIMATGCRGVPQIHHRVTYHDFAEEPYYHGRYHSVIFEPGYSQINLLLYRPNRFIGKLENESQRKSNVWRQFFSKVLYRDYITWDYKDIVGLPIGSVYNHKTNQILEFDDHLEIDNYFKSI